MLATTAGVTTKEERRTGWRCLHFVRKDQSIVGKWSNILKGLVINRVLGRMIETFRHGTPADMV